MIYIEQKDVREDEFKQLLERACVSIVSLLQEKRESDITPSNFEDIVLYIMQDCSKGTSFEGTIKKADSLHGFPDIVANKYFGVEVKMTIKDQWTSTGNSVLESSRAEDMERIFIIFGKIGGKLDVKYRLYQECLPEVSVTHSPRYRIDMNLPLGKSIFDKIGIDYDELRKEQYPIKKFKEYYRNKLEDGEELWWIDTDNDEKMVSPIIKPFRKLEKAEQDNFITEAMVLFPEIFGKVNVVKYERAAAYLIAKYNSVSSSLRDLFTAGGRQEVKVHGKNKKVSKIEYNLRLRAKDIKEKIQEFDEKTLLYYWRVKKVEKNRLEQWKNLVMNKKSTIFLDFL